jgi:signal transduction histidine kinase
MQGSSHLIRADRPELTADGLLALALTVFAQLDLRFGIDGSTRYGPVFATAAATAVATVMLAWRRRAPFLAACVVAAACAAPDLFTRLTFTLWGDFVPLLIALYSVARHARLRTAVAGAAVILLAVALIMTRLPAVGTVANIPFALVPLTTAFVAGRVLRRRQDSHRQAPDRARQLESERDATVRAAMTAERTRIARELHDIVAHCVSVMVIQAGAAEDLLDREPELARAPLRSVQETGRQAVGELGRLLGLLRDSQAHIALAPQPGAAQLGDLVEQMKEAGLPVGLDTEGLPRSLPPGVELTIYRIVQEALTNTLKHAGPVATRVCLSYGDHGVELSVIDDGRVAPTPGMGHGLIGMRERVALYGGRLEAGTVPDGGFAVWVTLPADGMAS